MELNQEKLNDFLGRAVVDFGAAMHAGLVVIGEKLGLYKALAGAGEPLVRTAFGFTASNCASAAGRRPMSELAG